MSFMELAREELNTVTVVRILDAPYPGVRIVAPVSITDNANYVADTDSDRDENSYSIDAFPPMSASDIDRPMVCFERSSSFGCFMDALFPPSGIGLSRFSVDSDSDSESTETQDPDDVPNPIESLIPSFLKEKAARFLSYSDDEEDQDLTASLEEASEMQRLEAYHHLEDERYLQEQRDNNARRIVDFLHSNVNSVIEIDSKFVVCGHLYLRLYAMSSSMIGGLLMKCKRDPALGVLDDESTKVGQHMESLVTKTRDLTKNVMLKPVEELRVKEFLDFLKDCQPHLDAYESYLNNLHVNHHHETNQLSLRDVKIDSNGEASRVL